MSPSGAAAAAAAAAVCLPVRLSMCLIIHKRGKRILCIRNGARYRGRGWDHMWNPEQLNMLSYWLPERATCAVMYDAKWMSEWGVDGSEGRVGGGGCRSRCGSSIWTVSIQVHKCLITQTGAVSLCFLWFHDHKNAPDVKSTLADFRFFLANGPFLTVRPVNFIFVVSS